MMDTLGSDPTSDSYIKPGDDDVWAFMLSMAAWIGDPSRKGVP
jgi:hypothetical protein